MSTITLGVAGRNGLGIDVCASQTASLRNSNISLSVARGSSANSVVGRGDVDVPSMSHISIPTLRSVKAMEGLLLAETGDSMVEFDICGGGSFREGHRIALATPGGGSTSRDPYSEPHTGGDISTDGGCQTTTHLSRQGTLLSVGAPPARNAAELKSLLGNANSRLKHGAAVLAPGQSSMMKSTTSNNPGQVKLEQAKPRARVEVDIILESNTCVQGSYLKGQVKIRVRKRSKKEMPVSIAEGKVRVVGFECIPNEDDRYTFYQCAAPLSAITRSSEGLYADSPDAEGFAEAKEGVHILPFALLLPLEGTAGDSKGVLHVHSGVTVRYIAIASIKVKDSTTCKHSIAHFYRDVEIWPRLNPSIVLLPSPRPLLSNTSKTLFMGGPSKLYLTAVLHRLHWIAGQRCYVKVSVNNETKKTVKGLNLTLIRTTTVFKPHPHLDAVAKGGSGGEVDMDACQTTTSVKQVTECTLEMGQRGAKGHASAKGWWTGVGPGDKLEFSHFISLPPDALSIPRGRLLEVEYTLRVSLNAGSLTSDVHVILPIRIINFLSVDPPPSFPLLPSPEELSSETSDDVDDYEHPANGHPRIGRTPVGEIFANRDSGRGSRMLQPVHELDESIQSPEDYRRDGGSILQSPYDGQSDVAEDGDSELLHDQSIHPQDLSASNSDEEVAYVIGSAPMDGEENAPRFADLYHANLNDGLGIESGPISDVLSDKGGHLRTREVYGAMDGLPTEYEDGQTLVSSNRRPSAGARAPGSFVQRVQEKLQALPFQVNGDCELHESAVSSNRGSDLGLQCPNTISELTRQVDIYDLQAGATNVYSQDGNGGRLHQAGAAPTKSDLISDSCDKPRSRSGSEAVEYLHVSDMHSNAPDNYIPATMEGAGQIANPLVENSDRSGSTLRGSRLLPKPPPTATLATSESSVAPLAVLQNRVRGDDTDVVSVPPVTSNRPASVTRNEVLSLTLKRPALAQTGSSASSVKAKIAELEQRMHAE